MPGYLPPAELDQPGADIEAHGHAAVLAQEVGKHPRAAAEVGHPVARLEPAQPDRGPDQERAAFGREHVIGIGRGMAVEKRDFLLLVLLPVFRLASRGLSWAPGGAVRFSYGFWGLCGFLLDMVFIELLPRWGSGPGNLGATLALAKCPQP